ncbi:NAD-dependent epimerase/dehydratase family protein [candidate division WWE3 bacterium]|nr:NAD-dependent epimerase/dehydratase family protein [candidate division WWE3 bacterium]
MPVKEQIIKKSVLTPTFLIAGGAGFIGSHLAEKLLEQQARVIVLDNFKTGKDIYVTSLLTNPRFAVFDVDINQGLPKNIQSVDYIIHLASVESYLYSRDQVNLDSLLTNALGTKNLLDLAQSSEAKFLLVSSIDVYEGLISPVSLEQYFGQTPEEEKRYSLSEAKRFAEALVWEFFKKNKTDVRIVRIPEVYGPRMSLGASGSMGMFLREVMENKDITIYGEGTEKEYYLYITDVIGGFVKALFNKDTKGQIFTIAPEEPSTSLEVAYLTKSLANAEVKVVFNEAPGKMFSKTAKIPDRGNISVLKWAPKVELKEGIKNTMMWFGYEPNEHSFKPAKLIEDKMMQKDMKTGRRIASIFGVSQEDIDTSGVIKPLGSLNFARNITPVLATAKITNDIKVKLAPIKKEETTSIWDFKNEGLGLYKNLMQEKELLPPKTINDRLLQKPRDILKKIRFIGVKDEIPAVRPPIQISPANLPGSEISQSEKNLLAAKPWNFTDASAKRKKMILISGVGVLSALVVFTCIPLLQTYFYTKSGMKALQSSANYLMQLDSSSAKNSSNAAFQNFYKAQRAIEKDRWLFTLAGKKDLHTTTSSLLSSASYFSKGTYNIAKGSQPFTEIWEIIKPNTQTQFNKDAFTEAQINFDEAKNNIQRAQGAFKNVNEILIPASQKTNLETYKNALNLISSNIDTVSLLATEVPNLLGAKDTPKRYMVLFQNSNEIRPTGGFIGSYAIVEFKDGKIQNLTIDDIYNPDGQIDVRNIQVAPPATLGKLLDEKKLYLRNANWDPDFGKTSETIKDLYFRVTDKTLDGVIALDLNFAQNLLRVTGPVYLTAFSEEISADNMYERAQFHSEFNYKDGSDQKRAFLTILGSKLLESIFALPNTKIPELAKEIDTALTEKHLLLNIQNSAFGAELQKRFWDGSVVKVEPSAADYLYVVNANVGGTKANYFVKNDMQYNVSSKTRDGVLRAELKLTYNHTGTSMAWPGGTGASIQTINTTGEEASIDIQKEITIDKVGNYVSFEKLIEVQPTQKVILTITYDIPQNLAITNEHKEYKLFWQKQGGTTDDSFTFKFEPPFGTTIQETSTKYSQSSNGIKMENSQGSTTEVRGNLNSDFWYLAKLK